MSLPQIHKVYRRKMQSQDVRVKLINEMLAGIRIIKLYAWENPFMQRVREVCSSALLVLPGVRR